MARPRKTATAEKPPEPEPEAPAPDEPAPVEDPKGDEAAAQGAKFTLQEKLADISRQEEAQAQGLKSIVDTTQASLYLIARRDEQVNGKLEQAEAGVESVGVGDGTRDGVAENEAAAKESEEWRKAHAT